MFASLPRWVAAGLLVSCLCSPLTLGQDKSVPPFDRKAPPGPPPDVPNLEGEVDARGPIHEGFAQPNTTLGKPGPVVPKMPPRPIKERPPSVKPPGSVWVPGYWSYDE